jgi:polyphosphate kinase
VFLGSADLMPRNLDRRIEVLVPVENARTRQELGTMLDSVFSDDTHAWELDSDGSWARLQPQRPEKPHHHQAALMRRAQLRARRLTDPRRK